MEVTHILLGRPWQFDKQTLHDGHTNQYIFFINGKKTRPWQFDKQTLHDGHTNQYIFFINGKKTTLLPLSPQEVNKDRNIIRKDKEEKEKGQGS